MHFPLPLAWIFFPGCHTLIPMRQILVVWLALLLTRLTNAAAKHIMCMPLPCTSHVYMHLKLARALTERGHEITLVIPSNIGIRDVLDLSGLQVIEYATRLNMVKDVATPTMVRPYFEGREADLENVVQTMRQISHEILTNQMLFEKMKLAKPDLFVYDDGSASRMFLIFAYRMGVPFAGLHFASEPFFRRIPFSPAVDPVEFLPVGQHMTFTERLTNFMIYASQYLNDPLCPEKAVATYAPEMTYVPMTMLGARAEVWLSFFDHILDYPRPTLPNVKVVGGIAASPAKPLPHYLQLFMDDAQEGVVIVSFGSFVLDLPDNIVQKFWEVFREIPFKVIFRSNLPSPDKRKLLTLPWFPQNDLLAHLNTKVFVTHCGSSGQYQALYHAVPMVGLPISFDQLYNAERMRIKNFGVTLDLRSANVSEIVSAIKTVATDRIYKESITRASHLFRVEFGVPAERAAFWLDHVMLYGGAYMRSGGQEIPLYQFYLMDVLGFLGAMLIIYLCLLLTILRLVVKKFYKKRKVD